MGKFGLLASILVIALAFYIAPSCAADTYVGSLKGQQCTIYQDAVVRAQHASGAATVRTLPAGYSVVVAEGYNDGKGPPWPETDEQTSHWWVRIVGDEKHERLGWVPLAALSCGG